MTDAEDKLLELHDLLVLIVNERIPNPSLRDDALQEALLAAWTRLEQGHSHGIAVHAAKQAAIDVARGSRMTGSKLAGVPITRAISLTRPGADGGDEYVIEPADVQAQTAYDDVDAKASLETLLAPLSPASRSLVLRSLDGATQREIAPELGVSHQAVSARLTKAYAALRQHLEADGDHGLPGSVG